MGKTCSDILARTMAATKGYPTSFVDRCKKGYRKIAIVVDEKRDYHYYRQDSNGWWSHKPGARKVTNKDAAGNKIYDPALADYNYKKNSNGYLNYDTFCSYMCVPRITPVKLKVGGSRRKKFKV
jgi:hypothetical protein